MIFPLSIHSTNIQYQECDMNKKKIFHDLQKLKDSYLVFEDFSTQCKHLIVVGNDVHAKAAKAWAMIPYSWMNLYEQHISISYLDHFSPDSLWEIIANYDLQETFIIFISYEAQNTSTIITIMRFIESISRFVGRNINEHIIIATNTNDDTKSELIECAELFAIKVLPLSNCIFQPIYPGVILPCIMWGLNYKRILNTVVNNIEYILSSYDILKYIFQVNSFFCLKYDHIKIINPCSDRLRPISAWWKELLEEHISIKYIQAIDTMKPTYYLEHMLHRSYTSILLDESLTRDSLNFNVLQWKFQERWNALSSISLKKWIEESSRSLISWIESNHGHGRIITVRSTSQEDDLCALMLFISLEVHILSLYLSKSRLQYSIDKCTYEKVTK